jgi:hypothetical protein
MSDETNLGGSAVRTVTVGGVPMPDRWRYVKGITHGTTHGTMTMEMHVIDGAPAITGFHLVYEEPLPVNAIGLSQIKKLAQREFARKLTAEIEHQMASDAGGHLEFSDEDMATVRDIASNALMAQRHYRINDKHLREVVDAYKEHGIDHVVAHWDTSKRSVYRWLDQAKERGIK